MNIREMIPGLDADALKTVRINATRLHASGTQKQRDDARDALVLIDEEVARRRAAMPAAPPKARGKTGDGTAKARAAKRSSNVGN